MGLINIGLVAFHINFLLLLGAMLIGLFVAKRIGRPRNVDVEPLLWRVFIASLVAARFVFVIAYFDMYQSAPWSILNILDGGFSPAAGILAAATGIIGYAWRVREGRRALLLSALTGGAAWAIGAVVAAAVFAVPVQMPQAELGRLDGSSVQFGSLAGKPMVVNLWATWCPPCIREMPVLRDAQKNSPDVVFVFVNQGESIDSINVSCEQFDHPSSELIKTGTVSVKRTLYSDVFRSLCPVTQQPDFASIIINYEGLEIMPDSLLRYVISFRKHSGFHESCCEKIFADLMSSSDFKELTVACYFTRRGGIEINPLRSNKPVNANDWRLRTVRQ